MNITVVGAGYVGLTTAALFANAGYKVHLIEINPSRLEVIRAGRSFFYEAGLDPLVAEGVNSGQLIATDQFDSLEQADVVFSCVGTPDNPDGSSNLTYVFSVGETAAQKMKAGSVFAQKSTVPVGTGTKIKDIFQAAGKDIAYVSNPEFLRESTAIADTLWFDRVVVGSDNKAAAQQVIELYRQLETKRETIAKLAHLDTPSKTTNEQYIVTSLVSAELTKVSSNAFLALKISFANSIAKLADAAGADITEVMDAVGADPRIGRAFLNAGRGYGGGCFPKDVSGLIASAQENGVEIGIMHEAADTNASMPGYIAEKIKNAAGSLEGKKVAVLGLAFKAGTSDARRSTAVELANILQRFGCGVHAYDPEANEEASQDGLNQSIALHDSLDACVKDVDIVCVATDWPEFLNYDLPSLKQKVAGDLFVDCMNAYEPDSVKAAGFRYLGVGRGTLL